MQRLYFTFAREWPGMGLLCLRIVAAMAAFRDFRADLAAAVAVPNGVIEGAAGLLLLAGLWTPIASGVLAMSAVWSAVSGTGETWAHILLAAMSAGLAMLGPGGLSVDARVFGRRRLIREP